MLRFVITDETTNQRAGGVENAQRHRAVGVAGEPVIEDRAIRWILTGRLFARQRCVFVLVAAHADRNAWLEQMHGLGEHRSIELAQWRQLIHDPDRTPLRRDDQIVAMHEQVGDDGVGQIALQRLPLPAVIERHPYALIGAGKQ